MGERVVVGTSGPVGLGQRFAAEIERLWNDRAFSGTSSGGRMSSVDAMVSIRKALLPHIEIEMAAAKVCAPLIGAPLAARSALSQTLVAMPLSYQPCLFQFDQQGAPEEATEQLPFVAIGSGQQIADPFLAFIRRIFWPSDMPSVPEGVFGAVWTLEHAIATHPGGVDGPVRVVVLERTKDSWTARHLDELEIEEHRQAIETGEKTLRDFRNSLTPGQTTGAVAPPPTPAEQ